MAHEPPANDSPRLDPKAMATLFLVEKALETGVLELRVTKIPLMEGTQYDLRVNLGGVWYTLVTAQQDT